MDRPDGGLDYRRRAHALLHPVADWRNYDDQASNHCSAKDETAKRRDPLDEATNAIPNSEF
jgi:hypothetical protein